jgi:hypothetical protein
MVLHLPVMTFLKLLSLLAIALSFIIIFII